ncbi:MAG: hypothetical protein PHN55_15125 [Dysgonamonadaceae bacterium]|nr:hypothetical protein [Dysgonamonadaceae bacterium]
MKTEPMEALKFLYSVEDPTDNIPMHLTPKDKADHVCRLAFKEGQSNPKIKQLEWRGDVTHRIKTNTSIGEYEVYKSINGDYLFYIDGIKATTITFNSLEKAKAFAQKDFEARVKKCLIIE